MNQAPGELSRVFFDPNTIRSLPENIAITAFPEPLPMQEAWQEPSDPEIEAFVRNAMAFTVPQLDLSQYFEWNVPQQTVQIPQLPGRNCSLGIARQGDDLNPLVALQLIDNEAGEPVVGGGFSLVEFAEHIERRVGLFPLIPDRVEDLQLMLSPVFQKAIPSDPEIDKRCIEAGAEYLHSALGSLIHAGPEFYLTLSRKIGNAFQNEALVARTIQKDVMFRMGFKTPRAIAG